MFSRASELLEGENRRLSATNACYLFGVAVLGFVIILMSVRGDYDALTLTVGSFLTMLGATKIMGKVSDASVQRARENPDPLPAQPTLQSGPTTVINTGGGPVSDSPGIVNSPGATSNPKGENL